MFPVTYKVNCPTVLTEDLLMIYNFFNYIIEDRTKHFLVHSGKMRGNGRKLEHGDFCLNVRETFFQQSWSKTGTVARNAEESSFLEIFTY